jgi:hypothetical protein
VYLQVSVLGMDLEQQRSVGILVSLAGGVAVGIVSVVRWWLHG